MAELARRATILLVDDDRITVSALASLFELSGYDVVTARDGKAALQNLEAGCHPSLIIADEIMPIMNGFEFVAALKQKEEWNSIPVALLSGNERRPIHASPAEGIIASIQKPVDIDLLLDLASRYCGSAPNWNFLKAP